MGGTGEYFTYNLVSVLSNVARAVGRDDIAQDIENKRNDIVKEGVAFDDKIKEEQYQFNNTDSPFQYFAGNMLTIVEKVADELHLYDVSQIVKDCRADIEGGSNQLGDIIRTKYKNFAQDDVKQTMMNDYMRGNQLIGSLSLMYENDVKAKTSLTEHNSNNDHSVNVIEQLKQFDR